MHVMEPGDLWEKYIDPAFRDRAPRDAGAPGVVADLRLEVAGRVMPKTFRGPAERYQKMKAQVADRYQDAAAAGFDAPSQLRAMDREGLDLAVLYPTRGLFAAAVDDLDPEVAAAICRAYNDWLARFCAADPSRLYGAALISLHDPDLAIAEARRAVEQLGFRGVFMRPNPIRGRNLHDPLYDPFWAAVEQLGVPVGFHEGLGPYLAQVGSDRFANHLMGHMCSHPMELMMASLSLIAGGVLERFPKLTVAFLEGNCGWLPWWLWRMDEHYEWLGHLDAPELTMKPSEYFRRQCFISTDCDETPLRSVIQEFGDDCIVFSTDYPHGDSKYPRAVESFLDLPGVSAESKRKILWDNPARLYRLASA